MSLLPVNRNRFGIVGIIELGHKLQLFASLQIAQNAGPIVVLEIGNIKRYEQAIWFVPGDPFFHMAHSTLIFILRCPLQ